MMAGTARWPAWTVLVGYVVLGVPLLLSAHPDGPANGDHDHHGQHSADQAPSAPEPDSPEAMATWARQLIHPSAGLGRAPLLRAQAQSADLVVRGRVMATRALDEGRLFVARVRPEHTFKGKAGPGELKVVEFRGARRAPEALEVGQSVLLVLEQAPSYSYLERHLDGDSAYSLVRAGAQPQPLAPLDNPAVFERWLALGATPASAITRSAALALIAQGEPVLTRFAMAEFARLPASAPLSPDEREAVQRIMEHSLPGKAEVALWLAHWDAQTAQALLGVNESDEAPTRAMVALAQHRLGVEPDWQWALEARTDDRPAVRGAAVRVLGLVAAGDARKALLEQAQSDPVADVRSVALHAIAQTAGEQGRAVLGQALAREQQHVRFEVGKALSHLPQEAVIAIVDHAIRHGDSSQAREYAATLMVFYLGPDHEAVQALRDELERGEVRRILSEGAVDRTRVHAHDMHDH